MKALTNPTYILEMDENEIQFLRSYMQNPPLKLGMNSDESREAESTTNRNLREIFFINTDALLDHRS